LALAGRDSHPLDFIEWFPLLHYWFPHFHAYPSATYRKPRPGPLRLPQGPCNTLHSLFCILLISNVLLSFGEAQVVTSSRRYAHPRCGRSAEDGSSRVPLPSGRTPRPFAVRVPRGPHTTPPTVRAGPTPTVAGCSRAAPERPLPKGWHLAARNPSAPPIRPD